MFNVELLRNDVNQIIKQLVIDINPYDRTVECAKKLKFKSGKKILISIGKASYTMGKAICDEIDIDEGVIITKYGHSKGKINNIEIFEAGHPILDENGILASKKALELTTNLKENDNVILCISGGGSALFEDPLIDLNELQDINEQLIKSGATINEINTIRKRLSRIKGGRFAIHCLPAHISAIILSDVVGNDLSTIASGPVSVDKYTCADANKIISKYNINVSNNIIDLLNIETPKIISNVDSYMVGSVEQLCIYTKQICEELGYRANIIKDDCKENVIDVANSFSKLRLEENNAYIIGGESLVEVKGNGLGGRNTELALLCAKYIKNMNNVCFFTFGSDGTDGPTDAAGGYVDGYTYTKVDVDYYLKNNDSYHALEKIDGLIKTGPTGTNINDVYVMLVKKR